MNTYISKFGVSLIALALVVAPTLAVAQGSLVTTITAPTNGANVTVNTAVDFTGSATGGDSTTYAFNWTWGDGYQTSGQDRSHTYTTTGAKTVTLRVTDLDGNTDTDTITINVVDGTTDVVISDIQVTNKTSNSATITWTTNIPSTSRVIYDTVSHSDISGEVAPNYGYANTTARDDSKVTSHSVTLSGLSASTQYFFRVLSSK